MAWNWVTNEIKGDGGNREWMRADCLGVVADIFARTLAVAGNCRFPLYTNPAMAQEWFDAWTLINE